VTVLRAADNSTVSKTFVGRGAHEAFFTPDSKEVWVADRALARLDIVDAAHGGVVGSIATDDGPSKVLFSPDGQFAYVNHIRSATIDVISVPARRVVRHIAGLADAFSSDMALAPDGRELWAAHKKTGQVSVVDVREMRVLGVIDTGPDTNHPAFVTTPDAGFVYLTVGGTNETRIYRRNGGSPVVVGQVKSSGFEPHGIWPSPDNSRIYVVNEHSDSVDVIDTTTKEVVATLPVGQEGQALVYVAGAVQVGDGVANLSRQGLDQPVVNASVAPSDGPGKVDVTVRAVDGLDMVQLQGSGLRPDTTYTAYGRLAGQLVPLLSFTTDAKGAKPQALAFVRFLGVYDPATIVVTPMTTSPPTTSPPTTSPPTTSPPTSGCVVHISGVPSGITLPTLPPGCVYAP